MLEENDHVNYQDDNTQRTSNVKPIREGQPMGGQKFGEENNTPPGDDKNNPSQNAGYTNEYFRRTEPSEEHPENTNFKPREQEGEPDYASAQPSNTGSPTPLQQPQNEVFADKNTDQERDISVPNELPDPPNIGRDDNIL